MYSFLIARIKPEEAYDFFTYKGKEPVTVEFRGKPIQIAKGTRFGVRPSSNGKHIRLIFPSDPNRVMTIDRAVAEKLAKGAK